MDIIQLINYHYSKYSSSQKKIADFILNSPEDACFASLREFTEIVNSTEVTVVNFTKKIGLNSFSALKKELQTYIRMRLSPNDKIKRAMCELSNEEKTVERFIENEQISLLSTFETLRQDDIKKAVSLLRTASTVHIIGHDASIPVVDFMVLRLLYLGLSCSKLSFSKPAHLISKLQKVDENSVFVLVSFPAHSSQMINLSQVLAEKTDRVITIVDEKTAPVAQENANVFACTTGDLLFYNSITAPISFVNLLCSLLAIEINPDFKTKSEYTDKLRDLIYK